jgi:hypothetical protein
MIKPVIFVLLLLALSLPTFSNTELNWIASPTPDVTYDVWRGSTSGAETAEIASEVTNLTYTDTTVAGTYYYVVRSNLLGVESVNSNEVSVTVPSSVPPTSPLVTGVVVTENSSGVPTSAAINFSDGSTQNTTNVTIVVPAPPVIVTSATATYVGSSTVNSFGNDGYFVPIGASKAPSYASLTAIGALTWTWPDGILCWYSSSSFELNINTSGGTHELTLELFDYDHSYNNAYRTETIKILDTASGKVLDTEQESDFAIPTYISWNVSGNITIQVINTGYLNAVVTSVLFNPTK